MRYSFSSLTVAIVLLFIASVSFGQSFSFRVLANKGNNQVTRNGSTESLKTGASLFSTDILITSTGSYVGLMHKTGKTVEVKTAGSYKISDLEKQLNTTTSTSASRYADYLMAKMNQSESGSNYRSQMAVTGAVERATSNAQIQVLLPNSIDVYGDEAIVRWNEVEDTENYTVTLKNIFDEVIYTSETDKTMVKLDFTDGKLANEKLVILNVRSSDNEEIASGDFGIKRMAGSEREAIENKVQMLRADIQSDSPLGKIIEASFYEENELFLDALTKYEEAIQDAPEVQDFQDLYQGFIVKYNLGS